MISEATVRLRKMEQEAALELNVRPQMPVPDASEAVEALLQNCSVLLQQIESSCRLADGQSTKMPPNVLEAMQSVHSVMQLVRPPMQPDIDEALEDECVATVQAPTDMEVMGELDAVDDSDEEALARIALRLKRQRRM